MILFFVLSVLIAGTSADDLLDVGVGLELGVGDEGGGEGEGEGEGEGGTCIDIKSQGRYLDLSFGELYLEQPFFVTFHPKIDDNTMVDNICYTYFALPDNPLTFQVYISRVYCDGSTSITSYVATECQPGEFRLAAPYCTFQDTTFAYAGCDTYVSYRCFLNGDCLRDSDIGPGRVYGFSKICRPMGLSCLKKVEEVIKDNGIPDADYYILPMKLPNKCVTSQICINEPPVKEFKRAVGLPVDRPRHRL